MAKFLARNQVLTDDKIYEFLIDDVALNDISRNMFVSMPIKKGEDIAD